MGRIVTGRQDVKNIPATPTTYRGVSMRSRLEAGWAATLDRLGIIWAYEGELLRLASGELYLPDLWLPQLRTIIEVKGVGIRGAHKTMQLAREIPDVIVLLGFPPLRRSMSPYCREPFLVWRDALGYDARLTMCSECSAWQWTRPQLSRSCHRCGAQMTGYLAGTGEIRFTETEENDLEFLFRGRQ